MYWVYVLYCNNNRFFIGVTSNINSTLESHFLRKGPAFTRKNKPIYIMGLYSVDTNIKYNTFFENKEYYAKWLEQKLTLDLSVMYDDCVFINGTSNITRKLPIKYGIEPDRPICHCGMLCELYNEEGVNWYGCPSWNTEHICTNILIYQSTPCYFMENPCIKNCKIK